MIRWKQTTGSALMLLVMTVTPAWAATNAVTSMPSEAVVHQAELSVTGKLTYVELEGGYYSVNGWALKGEDADFQALIGQEVTVTGVPFDGMSIQMVKTLTVDSIQALLQPVKANRALPAAVTVAGRTVAFDQRPVVIDGTLMVPLRFVVESAGGTVSWDGATQAVTVDLPDRVTMFWIGNGSAELNQKGVFYIQRNLLKLSKAPVEQNGRTLIPADALTSILGFEEQAGSAATLALVASANSVAAAPVDRNEEWTITGTIKQIEQGERTRILVEGAPMANGEGSLTWLAISAETKITLSDAAGTASDLAVGQKVVVTPTGPLLMSYPAQGGAASIQVAPPPGTPSDKVEFGSITGTIKQIETGERTRILVEGAVMANGEPSLTWVTVPADLKIEMNGDAVHGSDLVVGQKVEVGLAGPVLDSYPAQAGASSVRVQK
jgi:hypothetical protein